MEKKDIKARAVLKKLQTLVTHKTEISSYNNTLTLIPIGLTDHQKRSGYRQIASCYFDTFFKPGYRITIEKYRKDGRQQAFYRREESEIEYGKLAVRIDQILTLENEMLDDRNTKKLYIDSRIKNITDIATKLGITFQHPSYDDENKFYNRIDYHTYNIEKCFEFSVVCMTIEDTAAFLKAYAQRDKISQDTVDSLTERNLPTNVTFLNTRREENMD